MMRSPSFLLFLGLTLGNGADGFSPQHAAQVGKNALFQKPTFVASSSSSFTDKLSDFKFPEIDVALPDISLPSSADGFVKEMINSLKQSTDSLQASVQSLVSSLENAFESANIPTNALQEPVDKLQSVLRDFVAAHPKLEPLYNTIQEQLSKISFEGIPSSVVILVSAVVSYFIISSLLSLGQEPAPSQPYPNSKYNSTTARAYFDERPDMVIARGIQVAAKSLGFGTSLLLDYAKYVTSCCVGKLRVSLVLTIIAIASSAQQRSRR